MTSKSGKAKRIRFKAGDTFAIPLGSSFGYCRYLDHLVTEFFNLESNVLLPMADVLKAGVAFTVWVSKEPYASGAWQKIGSVQIKPRPSPLFYKQDPISMRLYLYQDGQERPAKYSECEGLENAAVWSGNHIEDRLRDLFAGRTNKWVESLKPKILHE